ncbi:hypothetical protein I3843_16G023600 [Carya illinoinensis]|uniref:Cytochrome P450 n=1 Tax=Carya illinoinensis TaxID=32201 RepID=A0A922D3W5_CARIL|nr:hypothetical protein I3842_16G020700 [Carya illinoinensis]KAG7941131.1 hypothetical protein I3843_16G023600 [Carya illinoinensis]
MASILVLFLFFLFLFGIWKIQKTAPQKILPPKAGCAWPVIGHLHLLGGMQPPHITQGDMTDKNGPIFDINLGMHRAIVVSSSKIAKECFTTNDKAFSNRPKALAMELMGYNYAMFGFTPYGSYWRHVRRITTFEVLSNHYFLVLARIFVVSDVLPYIRWLDLGGRISGEVKKGHEDFMDVTLSIVIDSEEISSYYADTISKATCQIGRDRLVIELDVKKLVYLQAIIKETMHLYPAEPLSAPRESLEDCTLASYHIPAGTRFLVNLSKIHRDPQVWSDPAELCPERFCTTHKDIDFKGQHFELIPFGNGRRVCPRISFALQVMQLTLANFLHAFNITIIPEDEPIDMTEEFRLTYMKATPLEVHLTPRLPSSTYA